MKIINIKKIPTLIIFIIIVFVLILIVGALYKNNNRTGEIKDIKIINNSSLISTSTNDNQDSVEVMSDLNYNQVLSSKLESQKESGYASSAYEGKIIRWQGKISNYYSQASEIKFCIIDEDHKAVDINKPCDWFWAVPGSTIDSDGCEANPTWYCHRMDYILNYYKVPFDKNKNFYNDIYTITGKINGIDCGVDSKCIPDIEIIGITAAQEISKLYGLKSAFLQHDDDGTDSLIINDKFDNNAWVTVDPERIKVSKILPSEVFFRDLKKIPGTDKYLGIYVKDYKIDEQNVLYGVFEDGSILNTCPDEIYGQVSVNGEYHLFLYENGKIISDKIIPVSEDNKNDDGSDKQMFSLINTKEHNLYLYNKYIFIVNGNSEKIKDKYRLERTTLLNFADYTGDGLQHEFVIIGFYLSCGHEERLIAGFNREKNEVIIYPIINDLDVDNVNETVGQKLIYWHDNFMPSKKGEVNYIWNCGDHGSLIESKKLFNFDSQRKLFELISTTEKKCEF